MDDPIGVLHSQRQAVKLNMRRVANVLHDHNVQPPVAIAALCNVIASIVATQYHAGDRVDVMTRITQSLPMYVKVYESGERTVLD
jgi:hypothetical protein